MLQSGPAAPSGRIPTLRKTGARTLMPVGGNTGGRCAVAVGVSVPGTLVRPAATASIPTKSTLPSGSVSPSADNASSNGLPHLGVLATKAVQDELISRQR